MLEYEWGSPSPVMLDGEESTQAPDPRSHMFDHYSFNEGLVHNDGLFSQPHYHHQLPPADPTLHYFYDPRAHYATSYPPPPPQHPSFLTLDTAPPSAFMMIPKTEEMSAQSPVDFTSRLGLNLGGRTYFSAADDDFMTRLYRRSRPGENGSTGNSPRCQAEGCNADLTHAKHYHRRHKVCEYHSKASTVVAAGLTQRFCQQCSRFHLLSEFDNGKRSCRKRLADHNRRRRKSNQDQQKSTHDGFARSPPDSGAPSSSSVTVRLSPPRMSLDCYRGRAYQVSSPPSSSIFFSS